MCSILDYSMPFGNIIDKNFKSLYNPLWIFETRIAITIMTNQHQHHDFRYNQNNHSALQQSHKLENGGDIHSLLVS